MCEYRVEGKLSVGGVPIEVPPKGFFSIALDRYVDFNTDLGHMLTIGYDTNTRELMSYSAMASHVEGDRCINVGNCVYESATKEMPFAYLSPTPPGSVTMGSILVRTQHLLRGQIDLAMPSETEVETLTFGG